MNALDLESARVSPACAVCTATELFPARHESESHSLLACPECGVWSVHPRPSLEQLRSGYDEAYYVPWRGEAVARQRMWERRIQLLRDARRGRLLDVGCAEGSFLRVARAAGFSVAGTELSPHGARRTAGDLDAPVHCGELVDAGLPAGSFAVVTFWHVLEHMLHPGAALAEARRILEPGGSLVVAVPNRRNPLFRAAYRLARGKRLHLYHPTDREQHLHHWDPHSLGRALQGRGFEIARLLPDSCALGRVKRWIDMAGRLHTWLAGEPRTHAMVALARPAGGAA